MVLDMKNDGLLALRVTNRDSSAMKIQEVLSKHGCKISMRLGLHDVEGEGSNICSGTGTMILRLCCSDEEGHAIEDDLVKIDGVKAKFIDF